MSLAGYVLLDGATTCLVTMQLLYLDDNDCGGDFVIKEVFIAMRRWEVLNPQLASFGNRKLGRIWFVRCAERESID